MKLLKNILLSLLISFTASFASGQHSSHWHVVTKGSDNGVYITSASPLDTFAFEASNNPYSYAFINVSGNSGGHVTILNDGGQAQMTSGIQLSNCQYVDVLGTGALGSGITYGFKIVNGTSVPLDIVGKSNYINMYNIEATNNGTGQGILWDKTEVPDAQNLFSCDTSYLYPTHMQHHHFHKLYLHNSGGEAMYIGSTGSAGRDEWTCNGDQSYPKPMGMGYIEVDSCLIDSTGRTGIQINGQDSGFAYVHDNIIKNCGYELNTAQGAGIALGGLSQNDRVYNNFVDSVYFNDFYSYANNHVSVYNNSFGHSGIVFGHVNPQANAACLLTAQIGPTTYAFINNSIGSSTANTQIVLYEVGNNMSTPDTICNSGTFITNTTGVAYSTSCTTTTYTLTASSGSNGTVSPSGVTTVNIGSNQTYTITPNTGYSVQSVLVDGVSVGSVTSYTFTNVMANHTISATFTSQTFTITVSAGSNGTISPGTGTVSYGSSPVYTITPSAGYQIANILIDGITAGTSSPYTFFSVTGNHTISATFSNIPPLVNAGVDQVITLPTNTVMLSGSASQSGGSIVQYSWTKVSGPTFTIDNANIASPTLTNLVQGQYIFQLTVTSNFGGTASDTVTINVNQGTVIIYITSINLKKKNGTIRSVNIGQDQQIISFTWGASDGTSGTVTPQ